MRWDARGNRPTRSASSVAPVAALTPAMTSTIAEARTQHFELAPISLSQQTAWNWIASGSAKTEKSGVRVSPARDSESTRNWGRRYVLGSSRK
eukprot:6998401-Pyramimonas_sp.AAC.1